MGCAARAAAALLFAAVPGPAVPDSDDALAIMKKMAANTVSAAESRRQYVYHQKVRSSLLRSNGQIVCRESREYDVVPQETTTEKKLTSFLGECRQGKQMAPYSAPAASQPGLKEKGTSQDGNEDRESIAGLIDDLANDSKSRDGIPRQLFPLGPEELGNYKFTLKGETSVKGRQAYDITFAPVDPRGLCFDIGEDKSEFKLHADFGSGENPPEPVHCRPWKGEVWVDAEDYQPIRIDTQLAKGVPWGVRVFLGINIRQLGFSLAYQRVANGVWFPATYGTEFRVTALWAYKRTITLSMENTDFRKTDAQSTIHFEQP